MKSLKDENYIHFIFSIYQCATDYLKKLFKSDKIYFLDDYLSKEIDTIFIDKDKKILKIL